MTAKNMSYVVGVLEGIQSDMTEVKAWLKDQDRKLIDCKKDCNKSMFGPGGLEGRIRANELSLAKVSVLMLIAGLGGGVGSTLVQVGLKLFWG